MLCKIYCLINPIDNKVFYVGSTIGRIKSRISDHRNYGAGCGWQAKRHSFIKQIDSSGLKIKWNILIIVNESIRDFAETQSYNFLIKNGHKLLQHGNQFNATEKGSYRSKKIPAKDNK